MRRCLLKKELVTFKVITYRINALPPYERAGNRQRWHLSHGDELQARANANGDFALSLIEQPRSLSSERTCRAAPYSPRQDSGGE